MQSQILAPVVALVAWSLIILLWMMLTRMAAMRAAGVDITKLTGTKGSDADKVLPPQVQWKAHNYIHLMEQPTLFYAICLALALLGAGNGTNAAIAWVYVGLRVAHSVVQATINRVWIRFALFLLSTLALFALTLHAGMAILMQPEAAAQGF
jgi:hypothetical protein